MICQNIRQKKSPGSDTIQFLKEKAKVDRELQQEETQLK